MLKHFFYLALFFTGTLALAHGEDRPGPNGGYIKMPANFHTELVADSTGSSFRIYLLDLHFKNPVTQNSEVKVFYKTPKNKKINLSCPPMGNNHFHCFDVDLSKKATISIRAKRDGSWATVDVKYSLPLKDFDPSIVPSTAPIDHSNH
jgi:hypothetical protein